MAKISEISNIKLNVTLPTLPKKEESKVQSDDDSVVISTKDRVKEASLASEIAESLASTLQNDKFSALNAQSKLTEQKVAALLSED